MYTFTARFFSLWLDIQRNAAIIERRKWKFDVCEILDICNLPFCSVLWGPACLLVSDSTVVHWSFCLTVILVYKEFISNLSLYKPAQVLLLGYFFTRAWIIAPKNENIRESLQTQASPEWLSVSRGGHMLGTRRCRLQRWPFLSPRHRLHRPDYFSKITFRRTWKGIFRFTFVNFYFWTCVVFCCPFLRRWKAWNSPEIPCCPWHL